MFCRTHLLLACEECVRHLLPGVCAVVVGGDLLDGFGHVCDGGADVQDQATDRLRSKLIKFLAIKSFGYSEVLSLF